MKRHHVGTVGMIHSDKTDTIIALVPTAFEFKTEGQNGYVTPHTNMLRVTIDGVPGYVDIDVKKLINRAASILRGTGETAE